MSDLVNKVLTLEGILLLVEVLYFRAAVFVKQANPDTAYKVAREAEKNLNWLMPIEQLQGESLIVGQLDGELLEKVIVRIIEALRKAGDIDLFNEQIEKIKLWFCKTFGEEPSFLQVSEP